MQQNPSWEGNWFSTNQRIPSILRNSNVHYHIHKCPPPVSILSQFDPVHTLISYFLNIHLNITIPPTPGFPKCPLSLRFLHQNPIYASPIPHTRYMPCLSHSSRFYHPNSIRPAVQSIQLFIMQLPSLPCYLFTPRPNFSLHHPILKYLQPAFLP